MENNSDCSLTEELKKDVRYIEGMKTCMNCGTCSAICPAAEFYEYNPHILMNIVQTGDEQQLEDLLKNDYIWYCGECMSCKTRCPRNNAPGLVIMALRNLAMEKGFFVESEKGRQQLFMKRVVGGWILNHGYCLYLEGIGTDLYPEQGPVWDWRQDNWAEVMKRLGANYKGNGPGILRKIPEEALEEIRKIFDLTGGTERFTKIEEYSLEKSKEMGITLSDDLMNDYVKHIYTQNSNPHHDPVWQNENMGELSERNCP
jgi:heterodisulfide reductase subunit C